MIRLITGEEALQEIHDSLRVIDDIDDVMIVYAMICREAKLTKVKPTGESAWVGYRLQIEE